MPKHENLVQSDFAFRFPAAGCPRFFRIANFSINQLGTFWESRANVFQLSPNDRMAVFRDETGFAGVRIIRFVQKFRGVRVANGEFVLSVSAGALTGTGRIVTELELDPIPTINEATACENAIRELTSRHGLALIQKGLEVHAKAHLMIVTIDEPKSQQLHKLAFRCMTGCRHTGLYEAVDVDAQTGMILQVNSRTRWAWKDAHCQGQSIFNGLVHFDGQTEDVPPNKSRLQSTYSQTRVIADVTQFHVDLDDIPGNQGLFIAPHEPLVAQAVSVHWASQLVQEYFSQTFGIGPNLSGIAIVDQILISEENQQLLFDPLGIAWYDPEGRIIYYRTHGETGIGHYPDTVIHEHTHHLIDNTIGLTPNSGFNQGVYSGCVEEGFADLFVCFCSFSVDAFTANWELEWQVLNQQLVVRRSISNPNSTGQPDKYQGDFWEYPSPDFDIHHNSTVLGHSFYLLSEGSISGVLGIGRLAAQQIAYVAMITLHGGAEFDDACFASISAATLLFGEFSQEHISTQNAWFAVGVCDKYEQTPVCSPYQGQTDVEPWLTEFLWQACFDDDPFTRWEFQVSTLENFSILDGFHSPGIEFDNNGPIAVFRQRSALKPGTQYFWRVRRLNPNLEYGLENGWRPVVGFKTKDKICTPLSPIFAKEGSESFHPWDLPFEFTEVTNARSYQIQVFDDSNTEDNAPILKYEVGTFPVILDLPIQTSLWWRVRPQGRGEDNYGGWSGLARFETSMPHVKLVSPTNDSFVNPWNISLKWKPVKGALEYLLVGSSKNKAFDHYEEYPDDFETIRVKHPSHTAKIILEPKRTYLHEEYYWRVRVIGPWLSTGDPIQEEGDPSEIRRIFNDGDKTIPTALSPPQVAELPPIINFGAKIEFKWTHVFAATQYSLTLFPFESNGSAFRVDWTSPVFTQTFDRSSEGSSQSQLISGSDASSPNGHQIYGFLFSIRAIGPNKLKSPISPALESSFENSIWEANIPPPRGDGVYYIRPPDLSSVGNKLIFADNGSVYWNGTFDDRYLTLGASQSPAWSPSGKYDIQLFSGHDCESLIVELTIVGLDYDAYQYDQPELKGSFRMRVHVDYGPFYQWSEHRNFTLVTKSQQKLRDNPSDTPPSGLPTYDCNSFVAAGGNEGGEFIVNLGKQQGKIFIHFNFFEVPDQIQIRHGDILLFDSGCVPGPNKPGRAGQVVGNDGEYWLEQLTNNNKPVVREFDGNNVWIHVKIDANCSGQTNTEWVFYIECT